MADPLLGANPTGARGWLHRLIDEAIRLPRRRSAWLPAFNFSFAPPVPARVVVPSHAAALQARVRRRTRAASIYSIIAILLLPTLLPMGAFAQAPAPVVEPSGPFATELSAGDLPSLEQLVTGAQAAVDTASASPNTAPDFVPEQIDAASAPAPLALPQSQPIFNGTFGAEMLNREVALVYYLNVYRRQAGVLPLRWNREMSDASRWFAHDAVITKPACSHTDSLGRGPGTRLRAFGYRDPIKWSEVIACGFTEPSAVVQAWVSSPEQRAMLLDPALREAGPGYYYSVERQRGYVVLKVSGDESFAPMVINDENPKTTTPDVTLSIHAQANNPTQMKVSNTGIFADVPWETFATERAWTLSSGIGWKTVYVLTRNTLGRTTLLSDQIYLGASLPMEQLTLDGSANIGTAFAISQWPAPAGAVKGVRLSMGWVLDSAPTSFTVYRGLSQVVNNAADIGGSELLLPGNTREAYARGTMQGITADRILTAYYRLKVSSNSGSGEVARLTVRADGRTFGPVVLTADQFAAANTWQEFGVTFAFSSVNSLPTADVELQRTGDVDVTIDAVRFYGQPLPLQSPLLWTAGFGPYRSQGVQARLDTAEGVGEPFDVAFTPVEDVSRYGSNRSTLAAYPGNVQFNVPAAGATPQETVIVVCPLSCPDRSWQATSSAPWLTLQPMTDGLVVSANPTGMAQGVYDAYVTVVAQATATGTGTAAATAAGVVPAGSESGLIQTIGSTMILVRLVVGDAGSGGPTPTPTPPVIVVSNLFLPVAIR